MSTPPADPPAPFSADADAPARRRKLSAWGTPAAEQVGWDEFILWFTNHYRQDEHVSLLGPTRVGKTTCAREILEARECVIAFAKKPEDAVAERFVEYGYKVQEQLEVPTVEDEQGRRRPHPAYRRIVLWPRQEQLPNGRYRSIQQMIAYQRRTFMRALEYARHSRRWTIFTDDALSLCEDLRLQPELKWFWREGGSAGLSLVAAAQRPAWVPREMYSAASHLFIWRTNDKDDLDRLADIGAGLDKRELGVIVNRLRRHEFLYLAPRAHPPILLRSKAEV